MPGLPLVHHCRYWHRFHSSTEKVPVSVSILHTLYWNRLRFLAIASCVISNRIKELFRWIAARLLLSYSSTPFNKRLCYCWYCDISYLYYTVFADGHWSPRKFECLDVSMACNSNHLHDRYFVKLILLHYKYFFI